MSGGREQPAAAAGRVRLPLVERGQRKRAAARARIAAQGGTRLTSEQRAHDPLAGRSARLGLLPLLGSLLLHGAIVVAGVITAGPAQGTREKLVQKVAVQVRPPPPPPEPKEPEPAPKEPEPAAPPPPAPKPKPMRAKPAAAPEPVAAPAGPPRVVGLSLESTVEGSGGPAFAVGNTRLGETAKVAPAAVAAPRAEATPNAVASRLPSAGVAYAMPTRKGESKPVYPEVLKSQGVEANVTVLLKLDAAGNVIGVQILKPAQYPEFNEAARKAALAEHFDPATRDGVAIPYSLSFTYRFRLEDR